MSNTPDPLQSALPPDPVNEHPHKPADDREEVYFHGSPLLRGEIGQTMLTFLAGGVLVVLPDLGDVDELGLARALSLVLVLLGIVVIGLPILMMKLIRYRISNYRIDYEHGLLSKSIDTLELWHVEDIKFQQSLLDRIFNVGTITVISHDETTPTLALKGVPNPRPLFETLKQRVIAVKRQRGVIKMDVG